VTRAIGQTDVRHDAREKGVECLSELVHDDGLPSQVLDHANAIIPEHLDATPDMDTGDEHDRVAGLDPRDG
jgi:hypothetical protein